MKYRSQWTWASWWWSRWGLHMAAAFWYCLANYKYHIDVNMCHTSSWEMILWMKMDLIMQWKYANLTLALTMRKEAGLCTGPYGWDATLALEVSPVKTWILNMRFGYAQYGKSMVMHVSMIWPNKGFQMSFDPIPKFTLYAIEEMTN